MTRRASSLQASAVAPRLSTSSGQSLLRPLRNPATREHSGLADLSGDPPLARESLRPHTRPSQNRCTFPAMAKAAPIPDLFDHALDPVPAHPVAEAKAEPRPAKAAAAKPSDSYSAGDIEVLEGLEPVRKRPGMYIGGTDERALHHLFAEVLDNAMDEAVAGHAKLIEVELDADGCLTRRATTAAASRSTRTPSIPDKSALEVIMTVLHSGGKFSGKAYETSGGLHGVGVSVVNALSERLDVTVWRDGFEWRQAFARGKPLGPIEQVGPVAQARHPDPLPARPGDLRRGRGLQAGAALPHGPVQGLSVPRRRDPLDLRARAHPRRTRPPRRSSTSPTAWPTSWPSGSAAPRRSRPSPSPAASSARARPARSNGP